MGSYNPLDGHTTSLAWDKGWKGTEDLDEAKRCEIGSVIYLLLKLEEYERSTRVYLVKRSRNGKTDEKEECSEEYT